ncbi:MAG: MoaD/ThiS family protein [Planctomycetota bacterium]
MNVDVVYHAFLREKLGRESELLVVSGDRITGATVLAAFVAAHPEMARLVNSLNIAVNDEIVSRDALFHEHDRIDILPPYGGG